MEIEGNEHHPHEPRWSRAQKVLQVRAHTMRRAAAIISANMVISVPNEVRQVHVKAGLMRSPKSAQGRNSGPNSATRRKICIKYFSSALSSSAADTKAKFRTKLHQGQILQVDSLPGGGYGWVGVGVLPRGGGSAKAYNMFPPGGGGSAEA